MKSAFKSIGIGVLLCCLAFLAAPSVGTSREKGTAPQGGKGTAESKIRWYGYEEGIRRGKQEGKKIFLNFFADWCHYCQVMEEKTFRDSAVAAYLNDHYIPIQVDSDRQQNIAREYSVQGLPTSFFIAEDGANIGSQPGYIPPDLMLPLLKYIHTDSFKKMDFKKFQEGK
ncbi:thioredoxin family protein [Desulfococcus sp.]|uniref:thioredoxin family protein n=1 Tax=Desulfococcus sp. TaxID=2025834 RepID=UPI00359381F2